MIIDREVVTTPLEIEYLMHAHPDCVLLMDAGGVLFNNVIEDSAFMQMVATEFGVDAEQLGLLYKEGDTRFEKNEVDVRDSLKSCLMALGADEPSGEALETIDLIYVKSVTTNEELFVALRRLRSIGRKLVLVNNEGERWEQLKHRRFGHLDLFDVIASSWKLRACKPEREYFRRLEHLLDPVPKERWWLVDDNEDVVAAARASAIAASRYSRTGRWK
jgi:putative hydrolase of the HAD superfamily